VGSSNGRTMGFGPINLGSNPSPTATLSAVRDALKLQKFMIRIINNLLITNNSDKSTLRF
jgi:hypothetical protein